MRHWLPGLLIVTSGFAGPPPAARFPVIGYYPSWSRMPVDQIPFDKLTHVNYAFVKPSMSGEIAVGDPTLLSALAKAARARGVKVCAAVGGWKGGDLSDWRAMAARPASRAAFAANLGWLCDTHGLDGIDIDWERHDSASAEAFAALMAELSRTLHARGRLLSATVEALGDQRGAHIHPEVFGYVDFLNIRAYDWNWGARNQHHSTFGLADSSLGYWIRRGCPRGKAVLGIPFYGRSYQSEEKPFARYRELLGLDEDAAGKDEAAGYFYNGVATVKRKAELAMRKGGGVMVWEISQDTTGAASLLGAIDAAVRGGKSAGR